jgi:hypothetical protein
MPAGTSDSYAARSWWARALPGRGVHQRKIGARPVQCRHRIERVTLEGVLKELDGARRIAAEHDLVEGEVGGVAERAPRKSALLAHLDHPPRLPLRLDQPALCPRDGRETLGSQ